MNHPGSSHSRRRRHTEPFGRMEDAIANPKPSGITGTRKRTTWLRR